MDKQINFKTVLSLVAMIVLTNSMCKDPAQLLGQCTACGDLDFLLEADCYPKIRGCLNYALPGPACTSCQSGYVLYQGGCMRQAVFNQLNKNLRATEIATVVVDEPPTLSYDQIVSKIGEDYGPYFTDANEQFLSAHPELGKGSIKRVSKLQTKKGIYLVIIYQSSLTQSQYEAVGLLDQTNETSSIYIRITDSQPKDPLTADGQIRLILGAKLSGFFIYEVRFDGTTYNFYYMNSAFNVYQVKFKQLDIGAMLQKNMLVNSMTAADLAKEQLLKKYPELNARNVLNVKKLQDFYSFTFDADTSASVKFTNFRFEVNKPIKTSLKMPGYDIYDFFGNFLDLFGILNVFNPAYYACLNLANSEAPELKLAIPLFSSSAKVARGNGLYDQYFSISFSKLLGNGYLVYARYTAENVAELLLIQRKPNTIIYSQKYNYNADPLFFKGYTYACSTSKVLLIPSISSVLMKVTSPNNIYYKVIYSSSEFMQFNYNKANGATTLISYTVQNQNILNILGAIGTTPEKTPPELYMLYLKTKKQVDPWSGIASILFSSIKTYLSFVNHLGTYKATIGPSLVTNITQISNSDCYDFTEVNKQIADKLEKFVRIHYNLGGFTRQLVQGKVQKIGYLYRILFSNSQLKQVEFKIEQLYTLFNVLKTIVHNDGYQYIEPNPLNADYQKMLKFLATSTFKGNKIPLLTEATSKSVRGFYNDGESTKKILINKLTGSVESAIYETKSDISTCTSFDSNGSCLNCPTGKLEYQGSCWDKIQGCKVQAGKSCLRCFDPFILGNKKCTRNCQDCF